MEQQQPTPEQIATALKYFEDLYAGKCPLCQRLVDKEIQVGRCVHSESCGHRLYQGKVGAFRKQGKQ